MVLTRDVKIQQGDSQRFVIPVIEGDNPDQTFYPNLSEVVIEFTIAESLDATSALYVASDEQITVRRFGTVKLGNGSFDFTDTAAEGETIPDSQDVVVVTIPANETETFNPELRLQYQCRFVDPVRDNLRLTPVKGSVAVNAAAPFSE